MSRIPRAVCLACNLEMRTAEIGVVLRADATWGPYYLTAGDRLTCDGCGASVVVGMAREPLLEHHQPGFAERPFRVAFRFAGEKYPEDATKTEGVNAPPAPRSCRVCGCTDDDCSGCVARTGIPCFWVEPTLCSACAPKETVVSVLLEELGIRQGDVRSHAVASADEP